MTAEERQLPSGLWVVDPPPEPPLPPKPAPVVCAYCGKVWPGPDGEGPPLLGSWMGGGWVGTQYTCKHGDGGRTVTCPECQAKHPGCKVCGNQWEYT